MKIRFLLLTYLLLGIVSSAYADINTERAMSKIGRDTKTYISSDCRASTEQEAYDNALEDLTRQISSYIAETQKDAPDAVYLQEVASIYQRLDSRISDNRYRVMLYVKKSDLMPLGNSSNSMMLTKTEDKKYEVMDIQKPEPQVVRDTISHVAPVEISIHPVLASLATVKDRDAFVASLTDMRKEGKISAAAAFPISSIDDFYVGVLTGNRLTAIFNVRNGKWINAITGNEGDPHDYPNSSAFWFTITK
ncbi:MAG: hypothetical protein K2H38_07640 [Muribaculaceae bacterium]|nr:hypothetical protein [Muribaculaceae bacterium]